MNNSTNAMITNAYPKSHENKTKNIANVDKNDFLNDGCLLFIHDEDHKPVKQGLVKE